MTTHKPQHTTEQRAAIVCEATDPCRDTLLTIAERNGVSVPTILSWIRNGTERRQRLKPALARYIQHMVENPSHTQAEASRALGLSRQRINQLTKG